MSQREIAYVVPGTGDVFASYYQRVLSAAAAADTTVTVAGVDMPPDQRDSPLLPELPYYYGELFRVLRALDEKGTGGAIIGCSADPGLEDAKSFCHMPVVGPLESALTVGRLHRWRVGIVVPGTAHEVRQYRALARRYGLDDVIATVEPVELDYPGEADMAAWNAREPERLRDTILDCHRSFVDDRLAGVAERVFQRSDADALYLGCTLWTGMAPAAQQRLDVPVIDPGFSALHLVEALAAGHAMS